jgi:hypothetical protein
VFVAGRRCLHGEGAWGWRVARRRAARAIAGLSGPSASTGRAAGPATSPTAGASAAGTAATCGYTALSAASTGHAASAAARRSGPAAGPAGAARRGSAGAAMACAVGTSRPFVATSEVGKQGKRNESGKGEAH